MEARRKENNGKTKDIFVRENGKGMLPGLATLAFLNERAAAK